MSSQEICFAPTTLYTYIFLLVVIVVISVYVYISNEGYQNLSKQELQDKVKELQDELYKLSLAEKKCQGALQATQQLLSSDGQNTKLINSTQNKFLDKIYNPLTPPENVYKNGSFTSPGYDSYTQYQMTGYITGNGQQYPVFARDKYSGRSDKQEYYTMNEGRNRIKIPFKTKNFEELYSGDRVNIPELGGEFTFNKYENEGNRYSPNII
jgi:hypothetical protein